MKSLLEGKKSNKFTRHTEKRRCELYKRMRDSKFRYKRKYKY